MFVFQLFVLYGNKAAKSVWAHNIPPAEQVRPDVSPDQRAEFILAKYRKGLYHKAHPLAASQKLLDQVWKWSKHPAIFFWFQSYPMLIAALCSGALQRLREVVCGPNVEETLSLLCSGARVSCSTTDPELHSAISVAESYGQALQTELLRHNEFVG